MKGFGFSENATVTVGGEECKLVDASDTELKCRTPAVSVQTTVFYRCCFHSVSNITALVKEKKALNIHICMSLKLL